MLEPAELASILLRTRAQTEALCSTLEPEDCVLQATPEASPTKWHLAHTTWFFDAFILGPEVGYTPPDPLYHFLFNSYYEAEGARHPRARRGELSRPTLREVFAWRREVTEALGELLSRPSLLTPELLARIELGVNHEQQHQELLVSDIKVNLGVQPLRPALLPTPLAPAAAAPAQGWHPFKGGIVAVGHTGERFAFDNEGPRHEVLLQPFELASRCVTNAEWAAFVDDGGYTRAELWLADGWAWLQAEGITAPLYWERGPAGEWLEYTTHGLAPLDPNRPVVHVSGFEAEAYAAWAKARLPTEFEWEVALGSRSVDPEASFLHTGVLHPSAAGSLPGVRQAFGDVWEWTRSAYLPYPGFTPLPGALGEYNGKFMSSQWVLRGGCCATPSDHVRGSYRNFYYPHQRWPFAGLRLARSPS